MKLTRCELRKIIYDFNCISNRLMRADFNDYSDVLSKFLSYISNTTVISDYINDCGICTQNLDEDFRNVIASHGGCVFFLGDTNEEEVRNIYAILNYSIDHKIEIYSTIALGYASSNKYQDKVKGFNNRVVMVLIQHIEGYLTKIGIDMGLDEKNTYSITVNQGQVNVANDNATITAVNSNGCTIDEEELAILIQNVRVAAQKLSDDDAEIVFDSLETIENEVVSEQPKKGLLRTAIAGLRRIERPVEFVAAVTSLVQFLGNML